MVADSRLSPGHYMPRTFYFTEVCDREGEMYAHVTQSGRGIIRDKSQKEIGHGEIGVAHLGLEKMQQIQAACSLSRCVGQIERKGFRRGKMRLNPLMFINQTYFSHV